MRRFVEFDNEGTHIIRNVHPSGLAFTLKVVLPASTCKLQGFIGLHLYRSGNNRTAAADGFAISTSTGNYRRNKDNEPIADGLFAIYPRSDRMPVLSVLKLAAVDVTKGQRRYAVHFKFVDHHWAKFSDHHSNRTGRSYFRDRTFADMGMGARARKSTVKRGPSAAAARIVVGAP